MRFAGTVLYAVDVGDAVKFYEQAFELQVRFRDDGLGYVEFETGGSTLAIAPHAFGDALMPGAFTANSPPAAGGVEIAFLTGDGSGKFCEG